MKKWICLILILSILWILDSYLAKWNMEGFEVSGQVKPVLLFMYGSKEEKDQKDLRKIFKDDYKEYQGYIDVQEWDVKKANDSIDMKWNEKVDYEIRYYPNGLMNKTDYTVYNGKFGTDLNEYVKNLETKQEDIVEGSGGGVDAITSAGKDQKGKNEDDNED